MKFLFHKYKRQILYVLFGAGTTLISFSVYFVCIYMGLHYIPANIISWIFSVLFAFATNKSLVFNDKNHKAGHIIATMLAFYLSRLFSLIAETALIALCVDCFSFNEYISKVPISIIVVIMNYFTGKFIVFGNKNTSVER